MPDMPLLGDVLNDTRRLVLDLAGTLSPYHSDPDRISVLPQTSAALRRVSERYRVAILTGRPCDDARRLLGPDLVYIGLYGAEVLVPGRRLWRDPAFFARRHEVSDLAEAWRERIERVYGIVQIQGATRMIHWGHLPPEDAARVREVADGLAQAARARGLAVYELAASVDIRPAEIDKDVGIDRLLEHDGPVTALAMAGDDASDARAFARIKRLVADPGSGVRAGCCIAVVHPGRPEPANADYTVEEVPGVTALLDAIAAGGEGR